MTPTTGTDFLVSTFDVVRPKDRDGNRVLARELLDNGARELRTGLIDQPEVRARMLETIGRVYRQIGLLPPRRSRPGQRLCRGSPAGPRWQQYHRRSLKGR